MYFNRIRSTLLEDIMTDWINYAWQDETVTILHFKYPFRTNYFNRKWANKMGLYLPTLYEVKFVLRKIKRHCVEIISYHNCTQWWILCAIDKLSKELNDSVNRAYTDEKNCILISWYVTGIPFCWVFFWDHWVGVTFETWVMILSLKILSSCHSQSNIGRMCNEMQKNIYNVFIIQRK